ncbi:MAG: ttgC [Rhodospirillales bacterium]|jgi:NodT family efflux transporter outer membrane factor (OMF) lipoprotein|nr:ttgC [Rhodospirillales bacterium]
MTWAGARFAAPMVVGLGLLASGCSLVPADNRPSSPIPSAWDTPNASGSQNAVPVHGEWWQSFNSKELTALVDRSLTGSFNLQAAAARIDEARGAAEIAGAFQYPAVALGGTVDKTSGQSSARAQSLFAQASYEIDFWGKNRAIANSAKTLTVATAFDKDTLAVTLVSSVADTYFQILSLQERVRLAQQIAASGRRILSLIEVQAAGGIASDLQIQQQRNAVATFDAAVPALRQQLEQSVHLLAVLVGSAPEGFGIGTQNLDGISLPEVKADLPASVLRQRPDIQAAEARLISSNFDVGAARAAFYPSIVLTGQGGIANSSLSHFFPPMAVADIAAGLVQPIFEGGRLQGQLKFDRAHVVELAATYRQTVASALQDVEDALTTVERLKELEAADVVAVDSARRAFDLANAQFRLGTADFLTVLTIERTLYQAEDSLLQVHLLRLEAAVGLFRALGGGFDPPEAAPVQSALRN